MMFPLRALPHYVCVDLTEGKACHGPRYTSDVGAAHIVMMVKRDQCHSLMVFMGMHIVMDTVYNCMSQHSAERIARKCFGEKYIMHLTIYMLNRGCSEMGFSLG